MKGRKFFLKIISVVAISSFTVLFLRFLVRGSAGDRIVRFFQKAFRFHPEEAQYLYQIIVRNNLDYIIIFAIVLFAVILSVIFISYSRWRQARAAKIAERRKNELITYLAHDIKTPLTSIIGYLSLLSEAPDMPGEERAKHINIALDKSYRLEELVNQFFEITQYSLQTITLNKKNIDLYYMLAQLTDEIYPLLAAHKKEAVINADEGLTVFGDPDKLARAFNNILKNAVVYSDDSSTIEIRAAAKGNTVNIEFKSAGAIPEDKLSLIFDKFNRLNEARSSDTGGAGLGLAIAKEIIVMHGGLIFADSKNGYTTFTVSLPENSSK